MRLCANLFDSDTHTKTQVQHAADRWKRRGRGEVRGGNERKLIGWAASRETMVVGLVGV
eukprot:SAG22_NODE_1163_length_5300_cov_18.540088_4_plen_59_part_00